MTLTFLHIEQTDSTNAYLQRLQAETDIRGYVVSACRQTAGKGMGSNTWESEEGKNLTFSIALGFSFLPASHQFYISKMVPVAIIKALEETVPEKRFEIKWPNDIYCEGHKIGGILINSTVRESRMDVAIIGIGLNVNQTHFRDWPTRPASLLGLTGRHYELQPLLENIARNIEKGADALLTYHETGNYTQLDQSYFGHLLRYHTWGEYELNGIRKNLYLEGLDPFGRLLLKDKQGANFSFDVKEIRFVL